jgi:hypothetical protein
MSFRIKYFSLSKAQVVLQLDGVDIEVLRNLLHCSTTYLPFGQRQQSSQVSLNQVKLLQGKWYQMEVNYSPVGSMPLIPLQITMSSVITYLDDDEPIAGTELGLSLISDFSATRFECQTVVDDDNSNVAMVTFCIPRSVKSVFPRDYSLTNKDGKRYNSPSSTVGTYCHEWVHLANHLDTKQRVSTGEESEKTAIPATRIDSP